MTFASSVLKQSRRTCAIARQLAELKEELDSGFGHTVSRGLEFSRCGASRIR